MAFNQPTSQWPLLLCGPILRRVTPTSVAVFVALSRACKVVLEIYPKLTPGTYDTPLQSRSHTTIALGKRLHVAVVEWSGPALQPAIVYGYDVRFEPLDTPGTYQRLEDLQLLTGDTKLGYGDKLPGFALPPALKDLKLLHGSCRKIHAPGTDALAIADDLIKNQYTAALGRPHQLFLTGDQIYADDVSICLTATLMDTAKELLGWTSSELMPIAGGTPAGPDNDAFVPGIRRGGFINNRTKFTAGFGHVSLVDGHLIFLGEYLAMYLFAWSDALWPRASAAAGGKPTLPSAEDLLSRYGATLFPDAAPYLQHANAEQALAVQFAAALPKVRRALANVPVYMMFDDHDVTDDWNLHGKWRSDAAADPSTRQMVRNGLIAYAIFQDWGNQPQNYAPATPGATLLEKVTYYAASGLTPLESQPASLDAVLDIQTARTPAAQRMRWDWFYDAAAGGYQIVALDTRTWRQYPGPRESAALIDSDPTKTDAALIAEGKPLGFQLVNRKAADNRLTILLSPAPIVGHPIVEFGQKAAVLVVENNAASPNADETARRKAELVREEFDAEAWSSNRAAFEDLLARLVSFRRVLVLSGDVHYAFSNQVAYFRKGWPQADSARLVQLCSSALHNEADKTRLVANLNYDYIPARLGWLGFNRDMSSLRGTVVNALDTSILSNAGIDPALARANARLLFLFEMNDRFSRPAVIPNGRYTTPQAFAAVRDAARDPSTQADLADWRYMVSYLQDIRTPPAREANVAGLSTVLTQSAADTHRRRLLVHSGRAVVGGNNIGQITFSATSGTAINSVHHRLYFQVPFERPAPAGTEVISILMFTEHAGSLEPPTLAEFPEVFQ